ncbi:glyoxalase [Sphingomonas sp. Leaf33]|uniref:VOC family protein n=1 Tax=Sphingomonas sp. Leaf33 TaxID=1736215 RepID=UPI0006FF010C|nr:VOC family protein [Sphingomonas sp. Leaf33]KQN19464.1 glyoxalase [Sphingomonas sp. Leaf33]
MANRNGTPIWFELSTPDAAAAADFYTAVAGWTVAPSPMAEHSGYRIATAADGSGIAGVMTPPPGAPAQHGWTIYFAVDDVDAHAARIDELGGAIGFGPMDIPHVGRFAIATDPQGVTFVVMRGDGPEDSQAFRSSGGPDTVGHGVWIELATPDPDGAFVFYGALFGWEQAGAMPMGPMGDYAFIGGSAAGAECAAGEATGPGAIMSSALTGAPPRWNWYVHVPDIDAAIATAQGRGGTLLHGPNEVPGGDFTASIADPDGSQLGLVGPRTGA